MAKIVVHGATLTCSCGTAPSSLTVLPTVVSEADAQPTATVDDFVPMLNIAPFGMCTTQVNPQVAAATAAALGTPTPQPCIPVTTAPWSPGSSLVTLDGRKALTNDSTCNCQWAGSISVTDAGSGQVDLD